MRALALVVAIMSALVATHVAANENLKKGLAKAQYMLRQANTEKAAVQKQLSESKKATESLESELASLKKDLAKARKRIDKLKSTNGIWQEEYEKLKDSLQASRVSLAKSVKLTELQEERFIVQTENFGMCREKNDALYSLNQEVLEAYSGKSFEDVLKKNDPFFGLKQVELENIVQEYQYRIDDLNIEQNSYLVQDTAPLTDKINSFN